MMKKRKLMVYAMYALIAVIVIMFMLQ
jgi:hypothetical protein